MRSIFTFFVVTMMTIISTGAGAETPKNALGAVTVSRDGTTVLAAGDNRVMYIIDAEKVAVVGVVYLGFNPLQVFYNDTGETVALYGTSGNLHFYSTVDWKQFKVIKKVVSVAVAPDANVLVVSHSPKNAYKPDATTKIAVYDLTTGEEKLKAVAKSAIQKIATSADATQIFAVSRERKTDTEEKKSPPKDLKGLEKTMFRREHDGKTMDFLVFDGQGAEVKRYPSSFSTYNFANLTYADNTLYIIEFGNKNYRFNLADGTGKLFKLESGFNYGVGNQPGTAKVAVGGLRDGAIVDLKTNSAVDFKISSLKYGWPEYFKSLAFGADGVVFAGTTAYRMIKIDKDGSIIKAVPIY
jgi:hypothetical protein